MFRRFPIGISRKKESADWPYVKKGMKDKFPHSLLQTSGNREKEFLPPVFSLPAHFLEHTHHILRVLRRVSPEAIKIRVNQDQVITYIFQATGSHGKIPFKKQLHFLSGVQKPLPLPQGKGPGDIKLPVPHSRQLKIQYGRHLFVLPQKIGIMEISMTEAPVDHFRSV